MADKHGIGTLVNESYELATDALDLFTLPPKEMALIHGKEVTIYPATVLTSDGPTEFLIPSDSVDFTALNLTRLEGCLEIVKSADDSAISDTDKLSIVNLLPHSLFKQVEVFLNDVQINDLSTPTYHYKSFIETHLTYADDVKKMVLKECEMYHKDDAGKENSTVVLATDATRNDGFMKRKVFFQGKKLYFSIVPHIDFFHCNRLLVPGVDVKLKFIRADDSFSILSDGVDVKIKINKLVLRVRRITADPSILNSIESNLSTEPAKYPIVKSNIKSQLINSGVQNTQVSQIIRGKLPRSFIVSFVNAKAYDGNRAKNPFVFENFGLNYFNILINGEPLNPTVFQPDFTDGNFIREYRWFLDNIGLAMMNATNSISKDEFKSNSCFFPFDLTPDLCNSFYQHGSELGTVDIQLGFKTGLPENVYCLLYASYDEVVLIDKNRTVSVGV